jgi:hypothetical protein
VFFCEKQANLMPKTGQNPPVCITSWLMGAFGKLLIMHELTEEMGEKTALKRGEGGGVFIFETEYAACARSPRPSLHDLRMRLLSCIAP